MGQKVNPKSFRLLITKDWDSRWITKNLFPYMLLADKIIRETIYKKFNNVGINRVVIERGTQELKVTIHTSRPGTIIGHSGKGILDLKKEIENNIQTSTDFRLIQPGLDIKKVNDIKKKLISNLKINISEIRDHDSHAQLIAQDIAAQLIKRMPYRKVIKRTISKITGNRRIKGIKISVSGRLGGVDIARTEKFSSGSIPLSSMKSNVDYAYVPALTTHGVVGVKVWLHIEETINK